MSARSPARSPAATRRSPTAGRRFFTKKVFAYYGGSLRVDGEWAQHPQSLVVLADPEDRPALLDDG